MGKSKKEKEKENKVLPLSEQLKRLQESKNNGRGVSCVRQICFYLRENKLDDAKAIVNTDWDKIANYPDIANLLMDNKLAPTGSYVNN